MEGLRDAVMGQAVTLARWIGNGEAPPGYDLRAVPRDHSRDHPEPFGLNEVGRRLAALRREPA